LPTLGFQFLKEDPKPGETTGPTFGLKVPTVAGAKAKAVEIEGAFVVLEDSSARKDTVDSLSPSYKSLRDQLIRDGKLVDDPENPKAMRFASDVPFTNPSPAAAVITGTQINGRTAWMTDDGKTYAEWHTERVAALLE